MVIAQRWALFVDSSEHLVCSVPTATFWNKLSLRRDITTQAGQKKSCAAWEHVWAECPSATVASRDWADWKGRHKGQALLFQRLTTLPNRSKHQGCAVVTFKSFHKILVGPAELLSISGSLSFPLPNIRKRIHRATKAQSYCIMWMGYLWLQSKFPVPSGETSCHESKLRNTNQARHGNVRAGYLFRTPASGVISFLSSASSGSLLKYLPQQREIRPLLAIGASKDIES